MVTGHVCFFGPVFVGIGLTVLFCFLDDGWIWLHRLRKKKMMNEEECSPHGCFCHMVARFF